MSLASALDTYFRGERDLGLALAVAGILLAALGTWVWRTQEGGFALGLLVPLVLGALGFGAGGGFLAARSATQRVELGARVQSAPTALAATELPRMEKVNANWPRAKAVWTVLIVVALGLLMGVRRDWASGLGLALLLLSTTLFFVDVFGERRAQPYTEALRALERG